MVMMTFRDGGGINNSKRPVFCITGLKKAAVCDVCVYLSPIKLWQGIEMVINHHAGLQFFC